MTIREIEAKSLLRKHKKIDSWFLSRYGMNLYRGCSHNCVYCDGRAEGYYVEGEFGEDVWVKTNAIEVLRRELDPSRKRVPFPRGFLMVGGGVGDGYQPIDEKYQLTRKALQLAKEFKFPVHMLTKSTLIERDLDLLKDINQQNRAIVSFSFSSVDDDISAIFEPGVPPPSERLRTLARFKKEGMACGMFLLPVIPFITDTPQLMENSIRSASEAGLDFVIFGGMTLKEGRQKEHFSKVLQTYRPELLPKYEHIYPGSKWGEATAAYYGPLHVTFNEMAKKYKMPKRIPHVIYKDLVDQKDLVVVLLEHIDYLLKLEGKTSPFGYAAYSLSQAKEPLSALRSSLREIKGVGEKTESIILEILDTGTSSYYEDLSAK